MKKYISQTKLTPSKQGALYSLNLGKNNGPYLAKDIMLNNAKSIRLLIGQQVFLNYKIVRSHQSMVKCLQQYQGQTKGKQIFDQKTKTIIRYDQRFKKSINSSQSIILHTTICQQKLKSMKGRFKLLGEQRKKFKEWLDQLQFKINKQNSKNSNQLFPKLRDFHNQIKQIFNKEKNQSYLIFRQIDQIKRQMTTILQQKNFLSKETFIFLKNIRNKSK